MAFFVFLLPQFIVLLSKEFTLDRLQSLQSSNPLDAAEFYRFGRVPRAFISKIIFILSESMLVLNNC